MASGRKNLASGGLLAGLMGWATSLATVAGLATVGWFGHATHWSFGFGGHDDAEHASPDAAPGRGPATAGHAGESPATAAATTTADDVIRFASPAAVEQSGIEVVPVEARPMVRELSVNGVVRYDERRVAQLSSRVPGSVWRIEKHLGDTVRRGDVLVIVESSDVGRLKAEFLNALVAFETKREQLAILEEVKGAVLGRQIRETKSALREARIHLTNAEQALVNIGFELSVADFEKLDDDQRASRIRTLGLGPEVLEGSDRTRITSNLLPLRAPFGGTIIGRDAALGEIVEASRPIFEVADVSNMWVLLSVNKEDAGKVALGQPVRFRPDGAAGDVTSRIAWISTEVNDASRTLEVRVEVAAGGSVPLRANTFGSGRIEISRVGNALVVPQQSVQWDGSRWVIFEPAGDAAFRPRPVQPGLREGELVQVAGDDFAASPPTRVVAAGSHVLKSRILLDRMESGEL